MVSNTPRVQIQLTHHVTFSFAQRLHVCNSVHECDSVNLGDLRGYLELKRIKAKLNEARADTTLRARYREGETYAFDEIVNHARGGAGRAVVIVRARGTARAPSRRISRRRAGASTPRTFASARTCVVKTRRSSRSRSRTSSPCLTPRPAPPSWAGATVHTKVKPQLDTVSSLNSTTLFQGRLSPPIADRTQQHTYFTSLKPP